MITLVSRWRALFPFLLLCWLVKKSTILAKTEKTGTKYKSFLSLWSYFHCALRSGKSVWSLHQRRPAGAFFRGQRFVSPDIQKLLSTQKWMLLFLQFLLVQCYGKDAAGSVQGNKWSKWGGDPGRQGGKTMIFYYWNKGKTKAWWQN